MARRIFLLMIAFLPGHALGADVVTPQVNPDSLQAEAPTASHQIGRLFFSPDERAQLDRIRQNSGGGPVSATEQITLNGIVRRSSGKNTVWVNRAPQHENGISSGGAVQPAQTSKHSAVLLLPSGKSVNLKAGQTFDTSKGKVREVYEETPAPSAPEAAK